MSHNVHSIIWIDIPIYAIGGMIMDKKAILRMIKELEYSLEYYKRDYETYGRLKDIDVIAYLEKEIAEYRSKIEG